MSNLITTSTSVPYQYVHYLGGLPYGTLGNKGPGPSSCS